MKKRIGRSNAPDDEWYTPRETADKVAVWLSGELPPDAPILCPADLLPDGSESEIPKALRAAGFANVRVTRNLPVDSLFADWREGETVVTNPPFSLLGPLRHWLARTGAKFCLLSRPGGLYGGCWTIPEMKETFHAADGRAVAAAWFQNIRDTRRAPPEAKALGDCALCEASACPNTPYTRDWRPGKKRKLFGWCVAARHGFGGDFCPKYTVGGKAQFNRFFIKET